jgi:uncharacterized protein (DUF1800 family)
VEGSAESERVALARICRRAGFGLAPGELDALTALGVDTVIDRLVDPDAHGIPAGPDGLFEDLVFPLFDTTLGANRAVDRWLNHLMTTSRPFEEWMAWYWHGHLVTSVADLDGNLVRSLAKQIDLFRRRGLGSFAVLLREVTIDPAMLDYLDGLLSTRDRPNENYAREMLELFTLGLDQFFEADVAAGARALTGWRVRLDQTGSDVEPARAVTYFDAAMHDDTPQEYLGRTVDDLDAVVEAAVSHEGCAPFVARRFGHAVLGPDADPEVLATIAERFRASDLDLRTLARDVLGAVAEDQVAPLVLGPVSWLLSLQRATEADLDRDLRYFSLYDAGQLPFWPPNVGGWPGGATWLSASATAVRYNLAVAMAAATPSANPTRVAARARDWAALADALGRPEGLSASTLDALDTVAADADGTAVLAVALASPDLVLA